ncbi:MAG: hypothetical protein NVSMB12_15450 [Acidimicrobiales bacterium]
MGEARLEACDRLTALSVGRMPWRLTRLPIPIPAINPTAAITAVATTAARSRVTPGVGAEFGKGVGSGLA